MALILLGLALVLAQELKGQYADVDTFPLANVKLSRICKTADVPYASTGKLRLYENLGQWDHSFVTQQSRPTCQTD